MIKSTIINFILIFFLFFAPTLKLSYFNHDYFAVSYVELLMFISFVAMVAWVPISLLRMSDTLLPFIDLLIRLVFATSIISTFFLPVSLGVIDGGHLFKFEQRGEALLFFILMIALYVLIIVFFRHNSAHQHIQKGIWGLTYFGVAYVFLFSGYSAVTYPNLTGFTAQGVREAHAPVSSKRNIFIVSFDQIQGSFFHGYLNNYPDKKLIFDNFVFYPDAASTYPNTNYSIASTLLGRIVSDSTETANDSVDSDDSITHIMKEQGYDVFVNYLSSVKYHHVFNHKNTEFNYSSLYENFRHAMNVAFGVDIERFGITLPKSLYGAVPFDLIDHTWQIDLHDFDAVISSMEVSIEKPTLYFLHFLGTHQPFIYKSDCSLKELYEIKNSQNIKGAIEEVDCMVFLFGRFIRKLQDLGVYDQSMIFLISDHGFSRIINRLSTDTDGKQYFPRTASAVGDERNIKPAGSYNPLLLFKIFDISDDFKIEMSPVSLVDIAPTICVATDIDCPSHFEGKALQNLIDTPRDRSFWFYLGGAGELRRQGGVDRLHRGLDEWWEIRSFKGRIYPNIAFAMGLNEEDYSGSYSKGDTVFFSRDGTSERHILVGWSHQETNHRWTDGPRAGLLFMIKNQPAYGKDLLLRLKGNAYLGGGLPYQTTGVVVNGREVATWQMKGLDWYEAVIPTGLVGENGLLEVVFNIGDPKSPAEVGESADTRQLGIAARELVIVEK
jgi:hypothetical protein